MIVGTILITIPHQEFLLRDNFNFKYGKVEARIKTLDGEGFWPAFWLLPKNGQWPCDGEIDIMEQWGRDTPTDETTGAAHIGSCANSYSNFQNFQTFSSSNYSSIFIYTALFGKKITLLGM